jgi:hypothetical protein
MDFKDPRVIGKEKNIYLNKKVKKAQFPQSIED